jgi:methionyl aminopeptidase
LITDAAETVIAGKDTRHAGELVAATKEALNEGILVARTAKTIGDITRAIEKYVKTTNFSLARGLSGHGVGYTVHEEPFVPNFGKKLKDKIEVGLVIAIEPMLCALKGEISFDKNEYTVRTRDGGLSAHFEHTVAFTEKGLIVLTE